MDKLNHIINYLQLNITRDDFESLIYHHLPELKYYKSDNTMNIFDLNLENNYKSSIDNNFKKYPNISVSGRINSGKSTISKYLENLGFVSISFAKPLKDIVSYLFDLDRKLLEGDTEESRKWREEFLSGTKTTPRKILQIFGTEIMKSINSNIWLELLGKNLNPNINYVVSDSRFLNEIDYLKSINFITIVVKREGTPKLEHKSETEHELAKFKYIIENNSTIEDLEKIINFILELNINNN